MKILALIPARGGSKRIPRKNARLLAGKPLVTWTIQSAMNIPEICDVVVSTDDEEISKISKEAGATVPWIRPAKLADDTASTIDVCLHALDWYEEEHGPIDGLLLLQPTSPFRKRQSIHKGIELFLSSNKKTVIGVSPAIDHPLLCFKEEKGLIKPFVNGSGLNMRSQDLEKAYVVNGMFYLIRPDELRKNKSVYKNELIPLISESTEEAIDIDVEQDWQKAEDVISSGYSD